MTGTSAEALDRETHRRLAGDLFNRAWTLLEQADRSPAGDDELLHCAHASAYHWIRAGGTAANRARSEWQCSRAYAVLGRVEPALHHGRRCLELCEAEPEAMAAFDLPFACEALARAHALAGDAAEAARWLERARAEGARIPDDDDRALLEADLATIPG